MVRRVVRVWPAARRVPRASPGPAQPAAARGRLAGGGPCGRARRGGETGRRPLGAAPPRAGRHERRLPDPPPLQRQPRCHGRRGGRPPPHPRPPECRHQFESSTRRVQWPNGARAVCLSGEEPERARGLNVDSIWADELACWQRAESTWDLAMLALRAGANPQALITTTPRRVAVLKRILAESTTVRTTDTTYANQAN